MERHAQVRHDALHRQSAEVIQEIAHVAEVAVNESETGILRSIGAGVYVAVEAVEVAVGSEALHNGTRVSAAAEGGVGISS